MASGCKKTTRSGVIPTTPNGGRMGVQPVVQTAAAPMKFRSLVESWISQANITDATSLNTIFATYESQKGQLPQNGNIAELTPASMQGIFIVAAQVCGSLKLKESGIANSSRAVFKDYNFSPAASQTTRNALVTDQAVQNSMEALIQVFLGRAATSDEKTESVRSAAQVFLNETISSANNTKLVSDVAVMLCTAVLSSVEAISI